MHVKYVPATVKTPVSTSYSLRRTRHILCMPWVRNRLTCQSSPLRRAVPSPAVSLRNTCWLVSTSVKLEQDMAWAGGLLSGPYCFSAVGAYLRHSSSSILQNSFQTSSLLYKMALNLLHQSQTVQTVAMNKNCIPNL